MKGWKSQLFKSCCLRSQEQHTLFSRRGAPRPSPGRTTMVAMVILSLPSYTPSLSSCLCQNACIAGLSPGKGRLYPKWVKCSGSTRTVCWNVGGVEWCAIFSVYANERVLSGRGGNSVQRYKSMDLTWPGTGKPALPSHEVLALSPFVLFFTKEVWTSGSLSAAEPHYK